MKFPQEIQYLSSHSMKMEFELLLSSLNFSIPLPEKQTLFKTRNSAYEFSSRIIAVGGSISCKVQL